MNKTIYDPRYRALIQRLRTAREGHALKQNELAHAMGVSRQWLGAVEGCQIRVDILQLLRWCRALRIDAVDLIQSAEEGR